MIQKTEDRKGRTYEYVAGDPLRTRIYTLSNGLKVYLSRNDRKPEVQVLLGVRAGSNNDPMDTTGLAHYLEHMMFKGTSRIGTKDFRAEKPLLDRIEVLFDRYGKTEDPETRRAIYGEIDSVSNEASGYAVAKECNTLFESIGASDINAGTAQYQTVFECVIPSGEIRRWAILESERFLDPVFRGFHTELETVYEEYNMRSANDYGLPDIVYNEICRHLYPEIPYCSHPVIGRPEHLKNPSLTRLREFYCKYYRANNMAIVLSGDIDYEDTMDIIQEWFGRLLPGDSLPLQQKPACRDLAVPVVTSVTDPGPDKLYLAWKIPGMVRQTEDEYRDSMCLMLLSIILGVDERGLLHDFVSVQRRALSAEHFIYPDADYSTFLFIAQPNDGQSLDDLRGEILKFVEDIRSGNFEDARVSASVNIFRKLRMELMLDNMERAQMIMNSFIEETPYDRCAGWIDNLAGITKDDVQRVAQRYLTDGYVCVGRVTGPSLVPVIEKPEISPIAVSGDESSAFAREFLSMESHGIEPRFPDFGSDLSVSTLPTGQRLIYRHNDVNSIFTLTFKSMRGLFSDRWLGLADDGMDILGSSAMSPEARRMKFMELAGKVDFKCRLRSSDLNLSGLQEYFNEMLDLTGDWVINARPDERAFRAFTEKYASTLDRNKDDFMQCQKSMLQYAAFGGPEFVGRKVLAREQLAGFGCAGFIEHVHMLVQSFDTITYYGPASEEEVRDSLSRSILAKEYCGSRHKLEEQACYEVAEPEVMVMDYDSPSAFVMLLSDWGGTYNPGEEALHELLNSYLGAVAKSEVRESRSLAYYAAASYSEPPFKGETINFAAIGLTQNMKVRECVETFEDIMRNPPASEVLFAQVKDQLMASLRTRRLLDTDLIDAFITSERLGYDRDIQSIVYRDVQDVTLEELLSFHKSRIGNHPLRYVVVGRTPDMDVDYLKSKGKFRIISKEEAFGY